MTVCVDSAATNKQEKTRDKKVTHLLVEVNCMFFLFLWTFLGGCTLEEQRKHNNRMMNLPRCRQSPTNCHYCDLSLLPLLCDAVQAITSANDQYFCEKYQCPEGPRTSTKHPLTNSRYRPDQEGWLVFFCLPWKMWCSKSSSTREHPLGKGEENVLVTLHLDASLVIPQPRQPCRQQSPRKSEPPDDTLITIHIFLCLKGILFCFYCRNKQFLSWRIRQSSYLFSSALFGFPQLFVLARPTSDY